MERKKLISTSPSGNPDYQYYLKSEADYVMAMQEEEIRKLRYERLLYKAKFLRTQANYSDYEAWQCSGCIKPMSYDEWLRRVLALAESYEARAAKITLN